jgi:hypothetical protein
MRIIFVFFLVVFLYSCSKDSGVENVYSVPEEFRLDMSQVISDSGVLPAFKFTTLAKIGCEDQELRTEYFRKTNNAYIRIIGVEIVDNCTAGTDYVEATISDSFEDGVYNVNIGVKDQVENAGTFTATSDKYTISLHKSPNMMIGDHAIKRLPNNIWWGAIYFEDSSVASQFAALQDYIDEHSSQWEDHQTGNYGLFTVDKNGAIQMKDYYNEPGYTGFCVMQNASESIFINGLQNLIDSFPGLKIFIASDKKILLDL